MFEKRLKKISNNLEYDSEKEYFILTHKKHKREIYFQNSKEAIEFIKRKFDTPFKKIIHSLVRFRLLQKFLKKIRLSSKFGDVIFVGGQIKGFDLKNKIVLSFTKDISENKLFIRSKEFQRDVSKEGFAPRIFELNYQIPFSREELLEEYEGKNDYELFRKLLSFYKYKGIKRISSKKYINFLINKMEERNIKEDFIKETLKKIKYIDQDLLITTVHGDFGREQVLLKDDSYIFIDWVYEKNLIIRDLITFFREKDDLLDNKEFNKLLEIYPGEVKKSVKLYLLLNEIYYMIKKGKIIERSKNTIKSILGEDSF